MESVEADIELVEKYNISGPRYTSYPTAVQFREADRGDISDLERYLAERNRLPRELSLYFHIPFCFSLCWYCGCTKFITKDQSRGDRYIDFLEREMDLIAPQFHPESRVRQIHFGGGTPTFLNPDQLVRLGRAINQRFRLDDRVEFGVEIDPRRTTRDHIRALNVIGCNRASLGVQDTNPEVQKAVHRVQSFEQTRRVAEWLREEGIRSLNIDLIYGLPLQTLANFDKTLKDTLSLDPDRFAVYSYAHLPQLMPAQRLLNREELPPAGEKLKMMMHAIERLTGRGYEYIGMDHFASREDEMARALRANTLQRNFQGYSTHGGTDLYAFGMSGISSVGSRYWQNNKNLEEYYEALEQGQKPLFKYLSLTRDDRIRREVIMHLMCKTVVKFSLIEKRFQICFRTYFEEELNRLKELELDGLIEMKEDRILINKQGRLFLRNIAIIFDRYFRETGASGTYSKTV